MRVNTLYDLAQKVLLFDRKEEYLITEVKVRKSVFGQESLYTLVNINNAEEQLEVKESEIYYARTTLP